jgi:hypothetical protein
MAAARAALARGVPEIEGVIFEPEVAAPRTDANPSTDVFVIRGAE